MRLNHVPKWVCLFGDKAERVSVSSELPVLLMMLALWSFCSRPVVVSLEGSMLFTEGSRVSASNCHFHHRVWRLPRLFSTPRQASHLWKAFVWREWWSEKNGLLTYGFNALEGCRDQLSIISWKRWYMHRKGRSIYPNWCSIHLKRRSIRRKRWFIHRKSCFIHR